MSINSRGFVCMFCSGTSSTNKLTSFVSCSLTNLHDRTLDYRNILCQKWPKNGLKQFMVSLISKLFDAFGIASRFFTPIINHNQAFFAAVAVAPRWENVVRKHVGCLLYKQLEKKHCGKWALLINAIVQSIYSLWLNIPDRFVLL